MDYTFEVVRADENGMEVAYHSPGLPSINVGTRLPLVGEDIKNVIREYAPLWMWQPKPAVSVPDVGTTGEIASPVKLETLQSAKEEKAKEIAAARYDYETGGILVHGVKIRTDRESQATISGAFSALNGGLISSVDWKTEAGSFVRLGVQEFLPIARAVAQHVQTSFSTEFSLLTAVGECSTIEEVKAITWPT